MLPELEIGPSSLENGSHQRAICLGIDFAWLLQANIGSTSVVSSFWPISRTFQCRGLTNLIKERRLQKGPADEVRKTIESSLQSHRRENVFVCGATRVVWICEDGGSDFTP